MSSKRCPHCGAFHGNKINVSQAATLMPREGATFGVMDETYYYKINGTAGSRLLVTWANDL